MGSLDAVSEGEDSKWHSKKVSSFLLEVKICRKIVLHVHNKSRRVRIFRGRACSNNAHLGILHQYPIHQYPNIQHHKTVTSKMSLGADAQNNTHSYIRNMK
jgi:hypothetical protein